MRPDIVLEDTTLRDGEQAAGVALSSSAKTRILHALIDCGISWAEIGIPALGGEELKFLQSVVELQDSINLIVWNRGSRADLQTSLDLGFRKVHIGLPTSDLHLIKSMGKDRNWLLSTAKSLVGLAKDRDAFVSISAEDLARTEMTFLQEYAGVVQEAGADRLRLSDTVGRMTPEEYGARVSAVVSATHIDIHCHAHNDFGLALANTLAGLHAGAKFFHATVNGMGERSGMADVAQCALSLRLLYGVDVGINSTRLTELSRIVAEECHQALPSWQPIVGRNAFSHESGIHARGSLLDTSTYEPFPPELVGGERRYVLGKHSGRTLVGWVLGTHGIAPRPELMSLCLEWVRDRAVQLHGEVDPGELVRFYLSLEQENSVSD